MNWKDAIFWFLVFVTLSVAVLSAESTSVDLPKFPQSVVELDQYQAAGLECIRTAGVYECR